jgi:hypothetical protein
VFFVDGSELRRRMSKIFSGRFLFTLIAAIVFLLLSLNGRLPVDKVNEIILLIIYAYFNRGDRNGNGKGENK